MSRAVTLAELADQAVFTVNGNTNFVGIGSTVPVVKLDVGGNAAVSGTTTSLNLNVTGGANITGVVTASSFVGSGAELTGISGLGTDVNYSGGSRSPFAFVDDANFVTENLTLGTSNAGASSGTIFTKERNITVDSGVTLTIANGKRCVIDILGTVDTVVS